MIHCNGSAKREKKKKRKHHQYHPPSYRLCHTHKMIVRRRFCIAKFSLRISAELTNLNGRPSGWRLSAHTLRLRSTHENKVSRIECMIETHTEVAATAEHTYAHSITSCAIRRPLHGRNRDTYIYPECSSRIPANESRVNICIQVHIYAVTSNVLYRRA